MLKIMALLAQYPPDALEARQSAIRAAVSPNTQIDIGQIQSSFYGKPLTEVHRTLVAPLVARQAVAAEAAGYDAVVPWGALDLGVEEARHLVKIPVVGLGRAACHTAAMLVERFGVICYERPHATIFGRLLRAWRVESYVTSIQTVDIVNTAMSARREELRERFIEKARWLVDQEGAQLILPLGVSMVPLTYSAAEMAEEIGVPVLDTLTVGMRLAETLASMRITNSRAAYPAASLD